MHLYHSVDQTWNLDRAKATGLNSNIDRLAIVQLRKLWHGTKPKFDPQSGKKIFKKRVYFRTLVFFQLLLLAPGATFSTDQIQNFQTALEENIDYKKEIENQLNSLKVISKEQAGPVKQKLAILYYRDQNHEKSFQIFLEALEDSQASPLSAVSLEEQNLYEHALKIYLDPLGASPQETAEKIRTNYSSVLQEHPDYYSIGYLAAIANANLGRFPDFFKIFYQSYIHLPNHYLAYKAKAVLHIKLFEREYAGNERERQRGLVLDNLKRASEVYPQDVSLYKMILMFSIEEQKPQLVSAYLNKIIDNNMMVPRVDIAFFVQQAVSANERELAQRFIDKAKEWYHYSRVINAAQEYLKK